MRKKFVRIVLPVVVVGSLLGVGIESANASTPKPYTYTQYKGKAFNSFKSGHMWYAHKKARTCRVVYSNGEFPHTSCGAWHTVVTGPYGPA